MREIECLKNRWLFVVLHTDLNFMTMFFSAKSLNTFLGGKKGGRRGERG